MNRYILSATLCLASAALMQAQTQPADTTVNRTVVVEQEYNPLINDARKMNVVPKVEPVSVEKRAVQYDATLMPAATIPATDMDAYQGKETTAKAQPGYVRLGYGNNNNLDVAAHYGFRWGENDFLNTSFSLDGFAGDLKMSKDRPTEWEHRDFRTRAAVDYTHRFRRLDFNTAAHFGLRNFNYLPLMHLDKQKFLNGDLHLGIASTTEEQPLQYKLETNLMLYQRQVDEQEIKDATEQLIRTRADVWGRINDQSAVGIAAAIDNTFYSKLPFDNHTTIDVNPYYRFSNEHWNVRAGAHIDIAAGYGKAFQVAPDVEASYNFIPTVQIYAQAKGGRIANDFRRLEAVDPYPSLFQPLESTYEQINAAVGLKVSPFPGLNLHLYGGYQMLNNDIYNTYAYYQSGYIAMAFSGYAQEDTYNYYAGMDAAYQYKERIKLGASALYRNWEVGDGVLSEFPICYKPELQIDAHVSAQPIDNLWVTMGYRHESRAAINLYDIDPVSDLYLNATYEVFRGIAPYVRVNNLLDKYYEYSLFMPAQGFNICGGVSFRF